LYSSVITPFPIKSKHSVYNDSYSYFLKQCKKNNLEAAFTTTKDINKNNDFNSYWLFENNNWIKINLDNGAKNRLGYGARVCVKTSGGMQMRQVHTGALETLPLHFGLGNASRVDEIDVYWPGSKNVTRLYNAGVNRTITINSNNSPKAVSVFPSSGSFYAVPAYKYYFTTVFSDEDGAQDIKSANFILNTSADFGALLAHYRRDQNLLFLYDGTRRAGGFSPGSDHVIDTPYCTLFCKQTTVSVSGNNLVIKWAVCFKPALKGLKNAYLSAGDMAGVSSGWQKKGAIAIIVPVFRK